MSEKSSQQPPALFGVEFSVIGHRGAAGLAPENTLESFATALSIGCDMIELDVHTSVDKHGHQDLIVIHDATLNRTTNGEGKVSKYNTESLRQLDAGHGESIPLLDEVWALLVAHRQQTQSSVALNIELKGKATAKPVAEFLRRQVAWPLLVSSFDHSELATFRAQDEQSMVAPLYDRWSSKWSVTAKALDASAVNIGKKIATKERIQAITKAGYPVFVYTVNDPREALELKEMGVAGVFSDRPDKMMSLKTQ